MPLIRRSAPPGVPRAPALVAVQEAEPVAPSAVAVEWFTSMYRRLFEQLCRFAERYLGYDQAQDVVQEVMQDLWDRWPVLSGEKLSDAFVFAAVRFRISNARRSEYREAEHLGAFLIDHEGKVAQRYDPAANALGAELAQLIDAAVAGMPERCREVWVLAHEHGFNRVEIAGVLGLSPETVKVHLTRAQRILRERLTGAGYEVELRAYLKQLDQPKQPKQLPPSTSEDAQ